MLFPSSFQYIVLIKQWLLQNGKLTPQNQAEEAAQKQKAVDYSQLPITDVIKYQTLAHRSQVGYDSRAKKERIWNFYMPWNIDQKV